MSAILFGGILQLLPLPLVWYKGSIKRENMSFLGKKKYALLKWIHVSPNWWLKLNIKDFSKKPKQNPELEFDLYSTVPSERICGSKNSFCVVLCKRKRIKSIFIKQDYFKSQVIRNTGCIWDTCFSLPHPSLIRQWLQKRLKRSPEPVQN